MALLLGLTCEVELQYYAFAFCPQNGPRARHGVSPPALNGLLGQALPFQRVNNRRPGAKPAACIASRRGLTVLTCARRLSLRRVSPRTRWWLIDCWLFSYAALMRNGWEVVVLLLGTITSFARVRWTNYSHHDAGFCCKRVTLFSQRKQNGQVHIKYDNAVEYCQNSSRSRSPVSSTLCKPWVVLNVMRVEAR